jgi:hypothetical protein
MLLRGQQQIDVLLPTGNRKPDQRDPLIFSRISIQFRIYIQWAFADLPRALRARDVPPNDRDPTSDFHRRLTM